MTHYIDFRYGEGIDTTFETAHSHLGGKRTYTDLIQEHCHEPVTHLGFSVAFTTYDPKQEGEPQPSQGIINEGIKIICDAFALVGIKLLKQHVQSTTITDLKDFLAQRSVEPHLSSNKIAMTEITVRFPVSEHSRASILVHSIDTMLKQHFGYSYGQ